eukprot:CAMPEP_0194702032 /NCGR_PEP_ID=MMETSP0295-20121207/26614_1 /TAXON_ID=39354 /ORGANISM="Heterosigma akashiwo, Strain CCMP2393" /LENGTH=111 /DNA_ID=CAMNT_0039596485 /DNA_START=813 /DNA_END=1146 /DNA_ORIENTATION=+
MPHRSFYVGSNFLREILGASTNISYMSLPISVICHQQQPSKKDPWGISHATRKGSSGLKARRELPIWQKNYPSGLEASADQSIWLKGCYIFETSHQHEERLKHASGQQNSS